MTRLWYEDPKILLKNLDEFFPNNDLSKEHKINALARFAIYFTILIVCFGENLNWLILSLVILIASYYFDTTEKFSSLNINMDKVCYQPTKNNPFMNYTISDLMDNPNRLPACEYETSKDKMRKEFRSHLFSDSSDIWGRYISDRNFYTNPNTNIVNDQTGFAEWCFGNSGECKTTGNNCLKVRDPVVHRGRITNIDD